MRKERTLLLLGIWVGILPFLGFPSNWRTVLFGLTSIALVYLSYLFYHQAKNRAPKDDNRMNAFVDNIGQRE